MYSPTLSGTLSGDHHSFSRQQHHSPTSHHFNHLNQFNHNHSHRQQQGHFSSSPAASYSTASSKRLASAQHLSNMTAAYAAVATANNNNNNNNNNANNNHHGSCSSSSNKSLQCLRFKYFTTFFVCTTCLALLAASLATHKWLVSRPARVLRLNNGQLTNFTALMLMGAVGDDERVVQRQSRLHIEQQPSSSAASQQQASDLFALAAGQQQQPQPQQQGSKFQGEIYFGLFNGVKVLNYGFGDRVSQLSVLQPHYSATAALGSKQTLLAAGAADQAPGQNQHELVNFKLWLTTLVGVLLAILFALIGSIFAIINFVMTPRGTLAGPVGLVLWNAAACFSCLLAMFAWLVEYFVRLKSNVLTPEEVQNGWTSENRSQFGYSYYFVVLAFVLHLVNIFIVSIVQAETWTSSSSKAAAKRQSRAAACEGVIMLY